jgi:hypothetical protein
MFNILVTLTNDASNYNKYLADQLAELRPLLDKALKNDDNDPTKPDKKAVRTILPKRPFKPDKESIVKMELEARPVRVEALPEKWRSTEKSHNGVRCHAWKICADELEKALGSDSSPSCTERKVEE